MNAQVASKDLPTVVPTLVPPESESPSHQQNFTWFAVEQSARLAREGGD